MMYVIVMILKAWYLYGNNASIMSEELD